MSERVQLIELAKHLGKPVELFIGMVSFESRCLAILKALSPHIKRHIFFTNKQAGHATLNNLTEMGGLAKGRADFFELDLDKPTSTADAILTSILKINNIPSGLIFVDITTFTHEQLLILVRVLSASRIQRRIIFGYTGADQYSTNTSGEDAWLSKGVSHIRSVLGFPGVLLPSKKSHLILLVGFEYERAKSVIEQYEPTVLSLGLGEPSQSVSEKHYETNQHFFEKVKRFVEIRTSTCSAVETFEFSCIDPISAKRAVLNQVRRVSQFNTVVCPMNTKISTLGVALAALENRHIQICYSRAITYNETGYSTSSKHSSLFELDFPLN